MGIRFSQSEFPVKTAKEHWLALAFYVAIVAFLASVLFGAFQLVRKTRHCGVPTRAAFWAWFVIVCGFWLLYLWKLISTAVFGSPNTGL
jgi:hypothetical protein